MNAKLLRKVLFTIFCFPLIPIIGIPDDPAPPAEPPDDPSPQTEPPAEPPDDPVPPAQDAELERLQAELAAEKAAKVKAERAAATANAEKKKLERAQMTETQLLDDQRKEIEEDAKKYKMLMASAKAKAVLSGTGLSEDEYTPILELITSDDEEKTEAIALEIKTILENREKLLERVLREKILKETPQPPPGEGNEKEPLSRNEQIYNQLYGKMKG